MGTHSISVKGTRKSAIMAGRAILTMLESRVAMKTPAATMTNTSHLLGGSRRSCTSSVAAGSGLFTAADVALVVKAAFLSIACPHGVPGTDLIDAAGRQEAEPRGAAAPSSMPW